MAVAPPPLLVRLASRWLLSPTAPLNVVVPLPVTIRLSSPSVVLRTVDAKLMSRPVNVVLLADAFRVTTSV